MISIVPRDFDVDFRSVPRAWMANNPTATAVANGVNLLFPHGERFFVRSVKHFLPQIEDPALRAQIKGFFGQEGRHAHAHDEFNEILRAQGYEIDGFLDGYKRMASWIEAHTPAKLNLAVTAAAEHFTAILAEGAFTENVLDAAAPEMRQLLAWHAAEEIEHKGVAYDTWLHATRAWPRRKRWSVKARVMLFCTRNFVVDRSLGTIELLRQDGITGPKAWARMLWFAWVRPGMLRKILGAWIAFFLPGFHPWKHDDRHLIAAAEKKLAPAAEALA